jgi:hypothetical protein
MGTKSGDFAQRGELNWQDLVAGVAVVAGAILCFVPGLQVIGGSLLIGGLSHFKMANDIYKLNGGNWNQASSDAGIFFGVDRKTDFGYNSGGKKDVANNNNPVESHPSVKTAGTSTGSYSNENQTTTNNSALNNTLSKLRGYVENNETVMKYFTLTSGYTRKETLNLLSLKSLSKLVIVGNTSQTAYGSFNADKKDPRSTKFSKN